MQWQSKESRFSTETDQQGLNILKTDGGYSDPFLPSPTGQGYINTPEEMIVAWWISKLSFKKWYAKNFLQQKLDFGND